MATLYETIRVRWPDLAGVTDAQFDSVAVEADALVSLEVYGTTYVTARVHAYAHRIYRTPGILTGVNAIGATSTGTVTSTKTGPLSVTRGAHASDLARSFADADLATTLPGLALLSLRSTRGKAVAPIWVS